ncbi:MAG: hypothetical protein RMX96_02660 [Nostoc sp. ChiSLP02]|nr:hypothetical protein [Nostoc sp. DedSLP05]MDZ8098639.1 hypothetical protein [Nostoc sp. DedSLP01]MDZ8183749.1 hypothetical protein [Nostoc sp. ChiSLP02]
MIVLPEVSIQTQISESATSQVYRGIRIRDGRAIALKLLKQDYPSPQEIIRYRQEYQITRSLDLEGVIQAYAQQAYQRTLVIFLEDFGGESIHRWMQQPNLFPTLLSSFLPLAINIANILGFARFIQRSTYRAHQCRHRQWNPEWSNSCPSFVY